MSTPTAARTYNQSHIARKHDGRRRVSIYWTWSYPWEAQRNPGEMYNRFSTMTEVRNALWPSYEKAEYEEAHFLQGIAGTLELFHRSTLAFQELADEATGHPVAVFQRIDQAGYKLPIDERILADTDTLMVFGLDHILSEQEAAPEEIAAIKEWLSVAGAAPRRGLHRRLHPTSDGIPTPRRSVGATSTAVRSVHAVTHESPRCARPQHVGPATRCGRGHQGDRAPDRIP